MFPVSAEQGQGIGELLDATLALFPDAEEAGDEIAATTVAVVGRPNVGKSSLVNRILGAERVVVSPEPGTTRDAVDTRLTYRGRSYVLVDTAGIRAKGRLGRSIERYGVSRALAAVRRADVALLLLDGVEGVTDQDGKIGGEAHENGCASIVVVNKWDLRKGDPDAAEVFQRQIDEQFKYLAYAPAVFVSALTGQRVMDLFDLIDEAAAARARRIPTAELNTVIRDAVGRRPPPADRGHPVHVRYVTQTGIKPPTFVLFTTTTGKIHFSYMRYLENALRAAYGFRGTPIRLAIRGRSEKAHRG
jgi:GTP-binding protein